MHNPKGGVFWVTGIDWSVVAAVQSAAVSHPPVSESGPRVEENFLAFTGS